MEPLPCAACRQPTLADNSFSRESIRLCNLCLSAKHRRNARISGLQLVLIWIPVCLYTPGVLNRTDLTGYWQSAHIIPAVLIALFLSAFVYTGLLNALRPNGLQHTGVQWSRQLVRRIDQDKAP